MRAGEWPREELVGREVFGKQLGLIGFGAIAREVATRATALGMRVVAFDPLLAPIDNAWTLASQVGLDELLRTSDAISLHVPLTDDTRHLIDDQAVAAMKPGAVIVNTARGGVIDEAALLAALRSGGLGGAALDVFEAEPVDGQGGAAFADVPNLLLTPHIAGITRESEVRVAGTTAANVRTVLLR